MAAYPAIGSEFNALESASWLFTGFAMAGIATQTLVRPAYFVFHTVLSGSHGLDPWARRTILANFTTNQLSWVDIVGKIK